MDNIKSLIEEHNQARKVLWKLHERGHFDYIPEILEKRRIIRRLREMEERGSVFRIRQNHKC